MKKTILIAMVVLMLSAGTVLASDLNIDQVKIAFLKGDYHGCIVQGEAILAKAKPHSRNLDELYYYLGLSYLKTGNFLRSGDIFEIIIKEFGSSKWVEPAELSLADSYSAKQDYAAARSRLEEFIKKHPQSQYLQEAKLRLNQVAGKVEIKEPAAEPIVETKKEQDIALVLSPEAAVQLGKTVEYSGYSVQVGAFSSKNNADSLIRRLKKRGYTVFISSSLSNDKTIYKVRIGHFKSRPEANKLGKKLAQEGFPTKIIP